MSEGSLPSCRCQKRAPAVRARSKQAQRANICPEKHDPHILALLLRQPGLPLLEESSEHTLTEPSPTPPAKHASGWDASLGVIKCRKIEDPNVCLLQGYAAFPDLLTSSSSRVKGNQ